MSGAQLESNGQIRNSYPYLSSIGIRTTLTLTAAGTIVNKESKFAYQDRIPFDFGPDKANRVFMVINGIFVEIDADSYATPPKINNLLYYKTPEGRKSYLHIFNQTIAAGIAAAIPYNKLMPDTSWNSESINDLGYLGIEDIGTTFGTATTITVIIYINVAFYANYAEPDWESLFRIQLHEHTGLPVDVTNWLDNERIED